MTAGVGASAGGGLPSLIEAEGVSVEIDGAVLLSDASLVCAPGECVAVRGPNGAGKTTLLRVLSGRLRPSAGRATLDGFPLDERRAEVRRAVAALLDPPALYPDLTIAEQLRLIAVAWQGVVVGRPAPAGSAPAPGTVAVLPNPVEAFDLGRLTERFPHELSSGQRQLVALAVTFARPARLLLLDEPEQRLDPDRRALVADAVLAARAAGTAVVFASHDAALVERVADRQLWVGE